MPSLPAISLHQPWASLIGLGVKSWETRSWAPSADRIGRRIAIHAAKRIPTPEELDWTTESAITRALGIDDWRVLPLGAIVCTAILEGAFRIKTVKVGSGEMEFDLAVTSIGQGPAPKMPFHTDLFGDYRPGRWCWQLSHAEMLPVPIPARGSQGWWNWDLPDPA